MGFLLFYSKVEPHLRPRSWVLGPDTSSPMTFGFWDLKEGDGLGPSSRLREIGEEAIGAKVYFCDTCTLKKVMTKQLFCTVLREIT